MNLNRDRLRSIGWAAILTLCITITLVLTLRVNAVKSQVRLAEREIVALRQERLFLETEFETRANQQQLKTLNDVEFGYEAPTSAQYLENERQLAAFGKPRSAGAPPPIRVASVAGLQEDIGFPAMVSPLTGKTMVSDALVGKAAAAERPREETRKSANLRDRLSQVEQPGRTVE